MRLPPPCKNHIAAMCRILFTHSFSARIIATAIGNCKREFESIKVGFERRQLPCLKSKGRAGIFRRSGYVHHHSVTERALRQLRGHRRLRQCGPERRIGRAGRARQGKRRLQAERCHRFHQHLRSAHQGAGHCKQRKRREIKSYAYCCYWNQLGR